MQENSQNKTMCIDNTKFYVILQIYRSCNTSTSYKEIDIK